MATLKGLKYIWLKLLLYQEKEEQMVFIFQNNNSIQQT